MVLRTLPGGLPHGTTKYFQVRLYSNTFKYLTCWIISALLAVNPCVPYRILSLCQNAHLAIRTLDLRCWPCYHVACFLYQRVALYLKQARRRFRESSSSVQEAAHQPAKGSMGMSGRCSCQITTGLAHKHQNIFRLSYMSEDLAFTSSILHLHVIPL